MSDLQNDKEIVRNLNSKDYQDIEAPLADQIPKKLLKQLREQRVGERMVEVWQRGNANRTDWLERQRMYLENWDDFLVGGVEGPFQQSSNLHIPISFVASKTYHARMFQSLLGTEPVPVPRRADAVERAAVVGDVMKYNFSTWCNYQKGIEEVYDTFLWDWITTGTGIIKTRWDRCYTKYLDVETVFEQGPPIFGLDEQGNEVAMPGNPIPREQEVVRVKTAFDGPVYKHVRPEDFLLVGGQGDPELADVVQERSYLTKSELFTLAYQKIFDEEAVKTVIEKGPSHEIHDEAGQIKDQRKILAGTGPVSTEIDLSRYEVLECYLNLDIDNSGIDSSIICWVAVETGAILRATYLYRVNKAGTRPFTKIDFHKRPGEDYGMGLVEIMYPLSKELDLMHNMRVDFGMISTMPFGFYRASSSLDAEVISYEPGQLIPLDNPQTDVFFPNLGNRTSFGMQEEQMVQSYIERLTGISDITLGIVGNQGATRTATGTRTLVGEANANLDVHIRRLFRGVKKLWRDTLHMLQQRIPPGLSFKVTGSDGSEYWRYIQGREDIAGDIDFEFDPSSAQSNPAVRAERAQRTYTLVANPLLLQMGIVSPANLYEAVKNVLLADDVKAFSKYITKPQGSMIQLSPEEMANRILRGQSIPALPTDDNAGFISFVEMIMKDDNLLGQFSPEETRILAASLQERQALLAAMQQQQAQSANIQQQAMNAQQSQFATPTAANGLGGP